MKHWYDEYKLELPKVDADAGQSPEKDVKKPKTKSKVESDESSGSELSSDEDDSMDAIPKRKKKEKVGFRDR
uniref:Uncharacterized protein n=1 Tax=Megaselia scalaris TaxID=36166 RepID=T1GXK6_MEGSC